MADKRIKSFSPYTYNVIYRKPGEVPFIKEKTYIPNAGYGPPEYIINKYEKIHTVKKQHQPPHYPIISDQSYFTYVNNTFFYLINDNCEIEFLKYSSNFNFLTEINEYKYENFSIYNVKYTFEIFQQSKFEILSSCEIRINHNLNSIIDLIILNNNEYFFDYKYIEEDLNNIKIKFNSDINLNLLKIIVYQIYSHDSSINRFNYGIINPNNDNFSHDDTNKRFKIRNIFGTTQLKLKITSIIGEEINQFNSINITPSYIFFDENEVITLNQLIAEKSQIEEQQFSNNENLVSRYEKINEMIDLLSNQNNYEVNIKTIEIYYPNENFEKKYIQFRKSNNIIIWSNDEENYYIEINHSLNGYVNYLIDNDEFKNINYKMQYISSNKLKMIISKNDQIPLSFSISLFKIGDNI